MFLPHNEHSLSAFLPLFVHGTFLKKRTSTVPLLRELSELNPAFLHRVRYLENTIDESFDGKSFEPFIIFNMIGYFLNSYLHCLDHSSDQLKDWGFLFGFEVTGVLLLCRH